MSADAFDNRLRPVVEFLPAAFFLIGAAHLGLKPDTFFPILPTIATVTAIAFLGLGSWRLWQACGICRYQKHLRRLPRYVLDAKDVPLSFHKLFLGRGFKWDQRHTQRLVESRDPSAQKYLQQGAFYNTARALEIKLEHSRTMGWLPRMTKQDVWWNPVRPLPPVGGFPPLHGVGTEDESDTWMDIGERVGHKLVLGTTRVGKTRLLEILVSQDIRRGDIVIVFDPKGDLGNLMLTFPGFKPDSFKPWINTRAASDKGQTPDEYAGSQAALWKKGLASWGQDGKRISRFREKTDVSIYTPGSNAGQPVSVLRSFTAPPAAVLDDGDLYRERVQATATGILALLDIDADPITSREHILISHILDHAWRDGKSLDIASLIGAIQTPPMQTIGVMSLDSFFPAKDRFELAMRLNNLLAAPGFSVWMEGEALDSNKLLYTENGKPRISIMSINIIFI